MPAEARRPAHRPRLLILTPDFPPAAGGIQLMAQRFAELLEGFELRVLTLDAPGAEQFDRERAVQVKRVGGPAGLRGGRNVLLNAVALRDGIAFRPQLILSIHSVLSPAAAAIRRLLGAPVVQYFHAEEIGTRPRLAAFAARHADHVIAVSRYTKGLIEGTGARAADMSLIPPGVDVPVRAPQPPQSGEDADRRPTLLTVARLRERYKGHDVVIRALPLVLAKVPRAQWIVIGEGPLQPALNQLAGSNGVRDAVRFLGGVADEERDRWLERTQLLVMPSRLPASGFAGEGFGIAYLEAGARGKPVVAGNVGGALDSVLDGETGLLVDPTDTLAVAEAIVSLLQDRELAERLGRNGERRAREYAWPTIARRLEEVLLQTLAQGPAAPDAHAAPPPR
jgi:phosphatidylinositol alpha-1,6-mannosyltransferase